MILFDILLLVGTIIAIEYILKGLFSYFKFDEPLHQRFLYFLLMGVCFLVIVSLERQRGIFTPIPISWDLGDLAIATILSITGLVVLLIVFRIVYNSIPRETQRTSFYMEETNYYASIPKWYGIILLAFSSGFFEELIFRYYIIDRVGMITAHLDWAVGLSSLLYGLIYLPRGWMNACFAGIIGFLLAVLFILTENILFVILIHIVWKLISLTMLQNRGNHLIHRFPIS
ncbi:CPBP family intramembrane glutamic endopeptidase [Ammoniphilus resinae]|uniref:Membrane protease YdiL (CAAX protease family) n=1 Tax=Ammoniphilus resinae TaxID=861532 RepID=A0ABS4GLV9_9BACL|nr:type II CAAX endopeptidase family protein [Ammoniphilus resinae]MBP1931236.1 membrane protease YdiL (CAAX protease family) [Ammoniphilus resinae]